MMSAGALAASYDSAYISRVMGFDWFMFYERFHGGQFFDSFKRQLVAAYDYVLIDGRTGPSDMGGTATVRLPDVLMLCMTLDDSAAPEALARTAEQVTAYHEGVRIVPIVTKVDLAGKAKADSARERIKGFFAPYLTHLSEAERTEYWRAVQVLYDPYYSYGPVLSTFGDASGWPDSMLSSMERICGYLTLGSIIRLPPVSPEQRKAVCAKFGSALNNARSCFISYSSKDEDFAQKLHRDLEHAGFDCWFAPHDLPIGAKIRSEIDRAIKTRASVVLILSQRSIVSAWVEKEVETAFDYSRSVTMARGTIRNPFKSLGKKRFAASALRQR